MLFFIENSVLGLYQMHYLDPVSKQTNLDEMVEIEI